MFYREGENGEELYTIDISEVRLDFSQGGDLLVLTLSEALPETFVPAQLMDSPHLFLPLQDLTVAYQDESRGLHVLENEVATFPVASAM